MTVEKRLRRIVDDYNYYGFQYRFKFDYRYKIAGEVKWIRKRFDILAAANFFLVQHRW